MSLKIQLRKIPEKKKRFFEIVVTEKDTKRNGEPLDRIGIYSTLVESAIEIDEAKAKEWLGKGAQPTDTVRKLFKRRGITA